MSVMTYDITIGAAWTVLGGALAALVVLLARFAYAVGETASKSRRRRDTTPYLEPPRHAVYVDEHNWAGPRRHASDLNTEQAADLILRLSREMEHTQPIGRDEVTALRRESR